jgi:hypothetical protein
VSTQPHTGLIWQPSAGILECYEARIVTTWSEYIRGVVIAEQSGRSAGGYTAYVEYFKFGVARQLWGKRVFDDRDQAKTWCAGEITRLQEAS